MAIVKVVRTILECLRCFYKWQPRGKGLNGKVDVRTCPRCKSPYWDKKRES